MTFRVTRSYYINRRYFFLIKSTRILFLAFDEYQTYTYLTLVLKMYIRTTENRSQVSRKKTKFKFNSKIPNILPSSDKIPRKFDILYFQE